MADELAPLTKAELERRAALEATVDAGLASFVEVGLALTEIRDSRLYRDEHGTFEAYCETRYGFSARRGQQLMRAAEIGTIVRVSNEAQARELAPLLGDPRQLREALAEVTEDGKPTGAKIKKAVAWRLAPKPKVPAGGKESEGEQLVLDLANDKRLRWRAEAERRGYSLPEFVDACVEAELVVDAPVIVKPEPKPRVVKTRIGVPPATVAGAKEFKGPDPKVKGAPKSKARKW